MKYTKPNFEDKRKNWQMVDFGKHRNNLKLDDIGIVFNDDEEHICDTVYRMEDAKLICHAPVMIEGIKEILKQFDGEGVVNMEWVYRKLEELANY